MGYGAIWMAGGAVPLSAGFVLPGLAQEEKPGSAPAGKADAGKPDAGGTVEGGSADESKKVPVAQVEFEAARERLSKISSVKARLVETISVGHKPVKAEGRYLQSNLKGNAHLLRLELTIKTERLEGSLLEVCDGDVLYTMHTIAGEPNITRRNVSVILDAVRKGGAIPEQIIVAELGLGGLPALLAGIEKAIAFTGTKADTLRNHPVTVVQGTWNDAMKLRLYGNVAKDKDKELPPLPEFVPDLVRIYFEQESGFPLRIMYLRKTPQKETLRTLLTLDFLDVALNQPIDPGEFIFTPPDRAPQTELTDQYLQQLKQLTKPAPAAPASPKTPPPAVPTVPVVPALPKTGT